VGRQQKPSPTAQVPLKQANLFSSMAQPILLKRVVGRSRYAAEKKLKIVYNSQRCPIPGTIKTMGGIS